MMKKRVVKSQLDGAEVRRTISGPVTTKALVLAPWMVAAEAAGSFWLLQLRRMWAAAVARPSRGAGSANEVGVLGAIVAG